MASTLINNKKAAISAKTAPVQMSAIGKKPIQKTDAAITVATKPSSAKMMAGKKPLVEKAIPLTIKNSRKQAENSQQSSIKPMAEIKDEKPHKKRKFYRELDFGLRENKENLLETLTLLLGAGMDIMAALEAIKIENDSWRMKRLIEVIQEDIDNGMPFWQALTSTQAFRSQSIALIKIGEESGRLVENLKVAVLQQQKEKQFSSKLRSAMMYPAFVLFVTFSVGLGIAWFVLPNLSRVFNSLNVELPLITKIMIGAGLFISKYGSIVVPGTLLGIIVIGYFVFSFKPTKVIGQFIVMRIPGVKKLVLQTEVARFGFVLGTLLEAGMPLLPAIDSLAGATEYRAYKKFYRYLQIALEAGDSFKKVFSQYRGINRLMPKSIQQLIVAGEQSGNLSGTLAKVGAMYEEKIELTTKNLSIILEPILLFIVWFGVLGVAVAVILPIYSLVGQFNH